MISRRKMVITALVWAAITLAFCGFVIAFASRLLAEERCHPVDPASLIYTRQGYSLAMGDGHVFIPHGDVRYDSGPLRVCMPPAGLMRLYLPSNAWPQFAHQKLSANSWVDRRYNKKNERCCDAGKDCHIVPPERVHEYTGGYILLDNGAVILERDAMTSEDGQFWLCVWGGQIKCFFRPYSGS